MTKEEIIQKIKDKLLENAIAEYNNNLDMCCGNLHYIAHHKEELEQEDQRLFEERVYLMQDYEDICNTNFKEEDLNFKYE